MTFFTLFIFPDVYGCEKGLQDIISALSIHVASLLCSIAAYRISPFHPLAWYPGPPLAKVTKFWGVWLSWTGTQHRVFLNLHRKHGPFVRTGPNELSVADIRAVTEVLGASGLSKGEWYSARQDPNAPRNLIVLTGEAHANRRRLWNRGLSTESLREYEPVLSNRVKQFMVHLMAAAPVGSLDISQSIGYFTFDFMGDMVYLCPLHMLSNGGDESGFWDMLNRFSVAASIISHIPWIFPIVQRVPFLSRDLKRLRKFGLELAMGRMQRGARMKDLWYHLSDEAHMEKKKPSISDVIADGALAVIAGADTTAGALTALVYFVLRNTECYHKLRDEVDRIYPRGTDATDITLHDRLVWMDACINETLRLQPPVPTNGPRQVPYDGLGVNIAGCYVPPGTQVYLPPYSIHRDPRYFSPLPDTFLLSRWLQSQSESSGNVTALNQHGFIPFSHGPANCVGRHLARMEIKMVISELIQKFDLQFAEEFDSGGWCDTIKDYLVTTRGPLLVNLKPRCSNL
ncbi:cytochrome P450 [Dichomitus squalens LYAD-421 SS1]|uniref:Cytochrome P450 n=1 Tax=Dichomitus squalens (strain LYAD-421) TaxID=732165 RepID=R7SK51_DICSQ|nr:cytochrome P450 [Dichomitus squalens LYAD-421 SS1]EJF56531.1 cytochrome P450 [Dichomitus squalens LYAD-421 SS1]